ncbi:shikimate dehydrogenase family protein, partial [Methanosarcina mazei]
IQALHNKSIEVKGKNIVIIGAGGAARAIAMVMAKDGAKSIQIVNRTAEKARSIAREVSSKIHNGIAKWTDINNISSQDVDIVVNCTSVGMYPDVEDFIIDPCLFNKNAWICDIVYKPVLTKFLSIAKKNGYRIMGGSDMLLYQAILSEEIWFDKNINIKTFLEKKKDIFSIL